MNGTPRLRSAFPTTPQKNERNNDYYARSSVGRGGAGGSGGGGGASSKAADEPNEPVIPSTLIDPPTQRLYAFAVYILLHAWRFYDYFKLIQNDADSLWLFLKWTAIDGVFVYGLPGMRIPWLEWSNTTTTVLFLFHALIDGVLMFRIPVPIEAWLVAAARVVYDRELSVSERSVNPAEILRNSSHILGKQIIKILPEGSAVLNPHGQPFCLDSSQPFVNLPLRINQTTPIQIEMLRIDLNDNSNETIVISAKQVRALKKQAEKSLAKHDTASPRHLPFQVRKTGLYRLQRVIDESKLEVQRRLSDTLVVECPRASITPVEQNKCKGELSNFVLDVYGTPPLKIKYSRMINRMDSGFFFQSIQPENLASPLLGQRDSGALVSHANADVSWAKAHHIRVPMNESLNSFGGWRYSIDEVHDASGNVANYTVRADDGEPITPKGDHLQQIFNVRERPLVHVKASESPCHIKAPRGKPVVLPLGIKSQGRGQVEGPFQVSYQFTHMSDLPASGEHLPDAKVEDVSVKNPQTEPIVHQPGLYTLKSISSPHCFGEVMEPVSCILENPPEPALVINSDNISDRCAGNSIGLRVDLDFTGTPPFNVFYDVQRKGSKSVTQRSVRSFTSRHQIDLLPAEAGFYTYRFRTISDEVYGSQSLASNSKEYVLEQDVKPPASAHFVRDKDRGELKKTVCLDSAAEADIRFQGEGPWTLEYEIINKGKRSRRTISDIEDELYTLKTDTFGNGGQYSVALVSVQDKTACKVHLSDELSIDVRSAKPKAAFGVLDGKRTALTLEGKKVELPVKLTGQGPWYVSFRRNGDSATTATVAMLHQNDKLEVQEDGTYELIGIDDKFCQGFVDEAVSSFEVKWIERPKIEIPPSSVIERVGETFTKKEVCEGDEDSIEISLSGTPPYNVRYEQRYRPEKGSISLSKKDFTAGLGVASIRMETSRAGIVEYKFAELGDNLYDHDAKRHTPLFIKQRVHSRPTARFSSPGKAYRYCKDHDSSEETIPITLQGVAPFYLELGIKHHNSARPEIIRVPNIESNTYEFRVPSRVLALGNHVVSIRKIRDSKSCERKWDYEAPSVPVNVADAPSITPLDGRADYCVGDRLSYLLSGTQPFNIFYMFEGVERKATSSSTNFRRLAEKPGNFTITALTDRNSDCKANTDITRIIHELPTVRISKGRTLEVDIHEGGEAEILFEFWGSPPFEFTYTRSTTVKKGKKPQILETKHETSYEHTKTIRASEEGTYEVIAIKDQFCSFSMHKEKGRDRSGGNGGAQKLLQ